MGKRRLAVWLVVTLFLGACTGSSGWREATESEGGGAGKAGIHGLQVPMSLEELARSAELIVRGIPISDTVHRFTENPDIPDAEKDDELYRTAGYHDVQVQVLEYLKGTGPGVLSVRRVAPPSGFSLEEEAPRPVLNEEQIFFLFRGSGVWVGGYLVLGRDGLVKVNGSEVLFPSGETIFLEDLRQTAHATAP